MNLSEGNVFEYVNNALLEYREAEALEVLRKAVIEEVQEDQIDYGLLITLVNTMEIIDEK